MKTRIAKVFIIFLMMAAASVAADTTNQTEAAVASCGGHSASTLVVADRTNATDILVLRITVENLIWNDVSEWPYRRVGIQKEDTSSAMVKNSRRGGGRGICADGGDGGYVLTISPSPSDVVTGTNIVFSIWYGGSRAGVRQKGETTIIVPTCGTASGRVDQVTFQSEWKPNIASQALGADAAPQPER